MKIWQEIWDTLTPRQREEIASLVLSGIALGWLIGGIFYAWS